MFGKEPPQFSITVKEDNLNFTWYSLNRKIINISCNITGQIIQEHWDALPEGEVNLEFSAKDLLGHKNHSSVLVKKKIGIFDDNSNDNSDDNLDNHDSDDDSEDINIEESKSYVLIIVFCSVGGVFVQIFLPQKWEIKIK